MNETKTYLTTYIDERFSPLLFGYTNIILKGSIEKGFEKKFKKYDAFLKFFTNLLYKNLRKNYHYKIIVDDNDYLKLQLIINGKSFHKQFMESYMEYIEYDLNDF